jgi:hypothetical protein
MSVLAPPECPFCGAQEQISLFSATGGQLITSQWFCGSCNTYFEAIRQDFDRE